VPDNVSESDESDIGDSESEKKRLAAAALLVQKAKEEQNNDSSTTEEDVYEIKQESRESSVVQEQEKVQEPIIEVKEEQLITLESSSSDDETSARPAAKTDPSYEEILSAIAIDKSSQEAPVRNFDTSSESDASESTIETEMTEIIETVQTVESSAIVQSAPKPESGSITPGKAIIGAAVLKEISTKEPVEESVEDLTDNSTPFVEPHKSFEGTDNDTDTESESTAPVYETIKVEETVETVEDKDEKNKAALVGLIVAKDKIEERTEKVDEDKIKDQESSSSSSESEVKGEAPAPPKTPPKEEPEERNELEKSVHFRENLEDVRIMEEVPGAFGFAQCTKHRFEMLSECHQRPGQKQLAIELSNPFKFE
jgi:hypothetical protein